MAADVTTSVTPGIRYRDAPAAIDWLVGVLGFRVEERHDEPDGAVGHARLAWRTGQVFLGSSRPGRTDPWASAGPASIALNTPHPGEVDACHARAVAAGAELLGDLEDTFYGSHQFSVRDPEGNFWTVGTYLPPITAP
ncbi:MAG TPA: VOC family protein [Acidimicrobiia bacterium]|nr:VOC family protein [Acidimicrobiia bacterium]